MDTSYTPPVYGVSSLSGSRAKATTREIRRALGPRAVAVIDAQGEALGSTVLPLLEAHGQRLDGVDAAITHLERDGIRVEKLVDRLLSLTFTQRLRWTLTGRL